MSMTATYWLKGGQHLVFQGPCTAYFVSGLMQLMFMHRDTYKTGWGVLNISLKILLEIPNL